MTIPARTVDQRLASLKKANDVRIARSACRLKMETATRAESTMTAIEILTRDRESMFWSDWHESLHLETLKVTRLLSWIRGYGPMRSQLAMARIGASQAKTVAGLSERQRRALVEILEREVSLR